MWAYLATVIHECSHMLAAKLLKEKCESVTVGVFGMKLSVKSFSSLASCLITALSGPAASLIVFWGVRVIRKLFHTEFFVFFEFANLCLALLNLIPAMPLDGGLVLKKLVQAKHGIICGQRIVKKITLFICVVFVFFCLILAVSGEINLSFWIFSFFLISSLPRETRNFLLEKKQVLCGETGSKKRLKHIAFDSESDLLSVAAKISPRYYLIVTIFEKERFLGEINQSEILKLINTRGGLCLLKDCIH